MVRVRGWLEARRKATANSEQGHRPTAWVAILLLEVIVLLLGPVLWAVGGWDLIGDKTRLALDAFDAISEPDKKVEAYGKLVSTIGLLAAAPIGMIGVGLAVWRTWNQHRDGTTAIRKLDAEAYAKAAEAFAKAVEQLGHDKSSIRMGAVLALEALGKSTPRLLSQTIEILCAYIRETRATPSTKSANKGMKGAFYISPPEDIKLMIYVISSLKCKDKENAILIDLFCADIGKITIENANFIFSNMIGMNLNGSQLIGAKLDGSKLHRTDLSGSNLKNASLTKTKFNFANLEYANLSKSNLTMSSLEYANLTKADMSKANLTGADLSGANLTETIFSNTILPDGRVWTGKGPPTAPPP